MEQKAENACGACDACCRIYDIEELSKPAHRLCGNACATGCAIYEARPQPCRSFSCMWLRRGDMGLEWRPDVAGFVMRLADEGATLWIDVDPQMRDRWRSEPYYSQIKAWSAVVQTKRALVMASVEDGVFVIFPEADVFVPHPPQGARVEAGYRTTRGGREPWVRIVSDGAAAA